MIPYISHPELYNAGLQACERIGAQPFGLYWYNFRPSISMIMGTTDL